MHDASKRSKQELAAEAEAKSAQIHLDKLEANDVNNIVASNEPTKWVLYMCFNTQVMFINYKSV